MYGMAEAMPLTKENNKSKTIKLTAKSKTS